MKKKSIYIEHMGSCPGRALDARKFESYFCLNGLKITTRPKKADYILFISCAYKKNIENLAIQRIKKLSEYKGELIVGGCLKGINEEKLSKYFKGKSFTTQNNDDIDRFFPNFKIKFSDLSDANILYPENLTEKIKRIIHFKPNLKSILNLYKRSKVYFKEKITKVYYIRIGQGCIDEHCSYCVIWKAVGKLKSKPLETCIQEFRTALEKGFNRIILIGENTGVYGIDINLTLPTLLNTLIEIEGKYEIQLECLHPRWIITYLDELVEILKTGKITTIDSPIQSGNSRILKLMNRSYDAQTLRECLLKLKEAFPPLKLHTHIIIGFPSETEEDFQDTLDFIKEIRFNTVQIFPFCLDEDFSPFFWKNKIPQETIDLRLKKATKFLRENNITYLID